MRLVGFILNLHNSSGTIWVNPEHVAYVNGMTIGMSDGKVWDIQQVQSDEIVEVLAGMRDEDPMEMNRWRVVETVEGR